MSTDYNTALLRGFVISKINGKAHSMLKEDDYSALQQCDTLYDIISKLTILGYELQTDTTTKAELKKNLHSNLVKEFESYYKNADKQLKILLNYYANTHKIQNFTYLLASKENDPELKNSFVKIEEIGKFQELDTLKFANDMNEVYKFCVEQTFLNRYYRRLVIKKNIKENDFQMINAKLQKMLIEDFYNEIEDGYIKEILKCEGDRKIIEIVLNTIESEIKGLERAVMFPTVTSIDMGMRKKLSECMSYDEFRSIINCHHRLRKIIGFEDEKIISSLISLEVDTYYNSFSIFNDISCVYAYFKLKEQEIKNIIWIVECISMKNKNFVKDIIIPKTTVE